MTSEKFVSNIPIENHMSVEVTQMKILLPQGRLLKQTKNLKGKDFYRSNVSERNKMNILGLKSSHF